MFGKKKDKIKDFIGNHISGLDIPNATVCVTMSPSGLKITAPTLKKEYSISLDRLQNITYYDEVAFEQYTKSSVLGGLVGATTFGVAGAIIGSRPKQKEKRKVHFYLLVEYPDNQIIIQSENGFGIGSVVDYFRELKPESNQTKTISL